MTSPLEKLKGQPKRKRAEDEVSESSIFDILENEYQSGDIVWAKLYGLSWWPGFVHGCFANDSKHVKVVSKPGMPSKKQYFVYCFGSHLKYTWVHQSRLCRYEGLEEFLAYSKNRAEQAPTKQAEAGVRQRFKVQIPQELQPLWKEAIEEADKMLPLPIHSRTDTLRNIVHRMLAARKEQAVSGGTLNNDTQRQQTDSSRQQAPQMLSSLCNLSKRVVIASEPVEKFQRAFSFNSTPRETTDTNPSTKTQSKSFQISTTNELDNDVVVVRLSTPSQHPSVSLTTAICHFLDKGIPSLTLYEENCLVNDLLNHRLGACLTLTDAQLYVEQYVIRIASRNFRHRMSFVQSDYFYDFLLKYPHIILQHRQWFKDFQQSLMPIHSDKIQLKKWQLATLLHAHDSLEQRAH